MMLNNLVKNKHIVIIALAIIVFMIMPFDLTIAPRREFLLLNENNEPISGSFVKQVWYQYSLGFSKEEESLSDTKGKVSFPARTIRTSLINLIYKAIREFAIYNIHASVSSTDTIGIFVDGYGWKWIYDGEGIKSGVVKISKIEQQN